MTPEEFLQQNESLEPRKRLRELVAVLTGPGGCPWDQKQTARTIIDFVIDEAHELKSALDSEDPREVTSELGDFLFTVEFLSHSLNDQAGEREATDSLVEKMIRRHPHVFGETEFADEADLKKNWEREKRLENSGRERFDLDIPASLGPLRKAAKVLARVSNAGFHYKEPEDALDKVWEELFELEECMSGSPEQFEAELGDLLLALLTLARMKGARAGASLNGATTRLCDRLRDLERLAGRSLQEIPHHELAALYARTRREEGKEGAFFNYCGVSTWPRPVRKAVRRASGKIAATGLSGSLELREEREKLRSRIAAFCGAPPESAVVYVPNVSAAALGTGYGQPWSERRTIALGRGEFPANTVPWKVAASTLGLRIVWFEDDLLRTDPARGWAALEQLLEAEKPALLAVSAVSFWSGFRVPLERLTSLCHSWGTRIYVDTIQALGTVPISMGRVDYFAGGSHKNLMAPEASGFLLVNPAVAGDWEPRLASWLSLPRPVEFLLQGLPDTIPNQDEPRRGDPTVLEGSSINTLGYAGLGAAIDTLSQGDGKAAFEHILALQDPLESALVGKGWESLRARVKEERSAILSFRPPGGVDLPGFHKKLAQDRVAASIPNGVLRFGFHRSTEISEVDHVIKVLSWL